MRALSLVASLYLALLCSNARAQEAAAAPAAPTAEAAPAPEISPAPAPAVEAQPTSAPEPPMPPAEPAAVPELTTAVADAEPEVSDAPGAITVPPVEGEETTTSWSLGAGLRLGTLGGELGMPVAISGAVGGVSSLGGLGYAYPGLRAIPETSLFAEYQLLEQLSLLAQARLGFGYMRSDNLATSFILPEARYDYGVGLSGGARYCLNPGGLVELSVFGVLYADYAGQRSVYIAQTTTLAGAAEETKTVVLANAFDAGLRAGLVLERELIEGVSLRLHTSLVRIGGGFGIYDAEVTGPDGTTVATDPDDRPWQMNVDAGVELNPTIELRLRF